MLQIPNALLYFLPKQEVHTLSITQINKLSNAVYLHQKKLIIKLKS